MVRKLKNIELNRLDVDEFRKSKKFPVCVLLDNIRSMHNVGSIFRTADALNVEKLLLCGITGTPPHREIHKTALGAEESMAWEYYSEALDALLEYKRQGYCVLALEQTETSVDIMHYVPQEKPMLLILGNEVEGVSDELLTHCDEVLEIPQFGTKHSFNVSVTGAIALWELLRKNTLNSKAQDE